MPGRNLGQGWCSTDGRENSDRSPQDREVRELTPSEPWAASRGPFAQTDHSQGSLDSLPRDLLPPLHRGPREPACPA